MYDLIPIEIAASGMRTQRARMGVIASNLANAHSTRSPDGSGPYKRRVVRVRADHIPAFADMLESARGGQGALSLEEPGQSRWLLEEHMRGAVIQSVDTDPSTRQVYDPSHPDADEQGYVTYPDISVVQEMVDMMSASRSYEANLAVVKNTRDMVMQVLEILKK